MPSPPRLELLWLPLGAGGSPLVRWSGRAYEAMTARRRHRSPAAIFHAALRIWVDGVPHIVEVAPAWDRRAADRGVVACGPVGSRLLGQSVLFRYEVRCWADGYIPDEKYAVDSPVELVTDRARASAAVARIAEVPTPVWGRDELRTGEMWNSNSVVAWLLSVSGHELPPLPSGGRAPGWDAGVVVATRGVPEPTGRL